MGDKKPESEMDKTNPGEKPEAETAVVETTDQSTSTPDTEQVTLTKAEYTKMQKALKDANAEAAKRRKELDDKEKVGLTETERLKKELEDERKERLILMQESVAAKHGLPEALASRLKGNTREEMEEDAKTLAAALPKPAPKSPGPVTSNNPNGKPILTLDQIKKMTPAEINKNWDVVQETLSSQSKVKS